MWGGAIGLGGRRWGSFGRFCAFDGGGKNAPPIIRNGRTKVRQHREITA
jgi:hypothetical protein